MLRKKKGKKWYNKNLIKLERMYIWARTQIYIDTGFSSDIIKVFVTKRCILESSVCLCACVCVYMRQLTTHDYDVCLSVSVFLGVNCGNCARQRKINI